MERTSVLLRYGDHVHARQRPDPGWKAAGYLGVDRWLLPQLGAPWSPRPVFRWPLRPRPAAQPPQVGRRGPHRALSAEQRAHIRAVLTSDRFVACAPREIYATLLDEGTYLCAWPTMYCLLREADDVRPRRAQAAVVGGRAAAVGHRDAGTRPARHAHRAAAHGQGPVAVRLLRVMALAVPLLSYHPSAISHPRPTTAAPLGL